MKKGMIPLLACLALAACTPAASPSPAAAKTILVPASPPASSATREPGPTAPPSTKMPVACDPTSVDYCIVDGHFLLQRPIHIPDDDSVEGTYPFGSTEGGTREVHHGVEFINATGTPVFAAGDGTVVYAGADTEADYSPWRNFYGNVIVIRHADDIFTLYAHLSIIDVQSGDEVEAGGRIGEVGKTGGAIGSHLHFEVRQGDVEDYLSAVNPELWLMPRPGEGVLSVSVVDAKGDFLKAAITIQSDGRSYYIHTYEEKFPGVEENAALGDLPPGRYRITFYAGGTFQERWVEVQAGKLTQVIFTVK